MKNKMKEYEEFIRKEIAKGNWGKDLLLFHEEMVRCFQHERLVHLIIMLFFIFMTLIFLGISFLTALIFTGDCWYCGLPVYILTLILVCLSVAYVKHYYFLENHIQKMYDYFLNK